MAEEEMYFEGDVRKHWEAIIPIALLILIAIVIIGKTTNLLCGVPGLGDLVCGIPGVNILILGNLTGEDTNVAAPELKVWLQTEAMKWHIYGVSGLYGEYPVEVLEYNPDLVNQYDIVILVGQRNMSYAVKEVLKNYVANGGKLVIIGDAATRYAEEPAALGWGKLQDVMPVQLKRKGSVLEPEAALEPIEITNGVVLFVVTNHPLATAYRNLAINLQSTSCNNISALDVWPTQNGKPIAILKGDNGAETLAIVESTPSLFERGKVIYFAYDPGCTPGAWIATLEYLMQADLATGKRW